MSETVLGDMLIRYRADIGQLAKKREQQMVVDLVAIEPVQMSFDYSEYSPELAASLERHAVNMEGFTKRYAVDMGKELAEAKAEIHAEKQTGWAKWAEGRLGITVRWADKVIEKYEKPKIENLVPNFLPDATPRLNLPIEVQEEAEDEEEYEYPFQLTEEDRFMAQVEVGSIEYSRDGHALVKERDKRNGAPAALLSSDSNEWYTPEEYINAASALMRGIDLDPASNSIANETVKAARYYDITQNGLDKDWTGRVWLTPPYGFEDGRSNQEVWSHRLIEQYKAGVTTEAILLVNNATEAKWFQPLYDYLICFTNHRIRFNNSQGESSQPTQGNALVYFGKQRKRFIELFSRFGRVEKEARVEDERE